MTTEKIKRHLEVFCSKIGERRVGSEQNSRATDYAAQVLKQAGWQVEETELDVMDWKTEGATLTCGGEVFEVFSSHYSLGCDVRGRIRRIGHRHNVLHGHLYTPLRVFARSAGGHCPAQW